MRWRRRLTGELAPLGYVALLVALALPASTEAQPAGNAHPTGGTVVAGAASLAYNGTTSTVRQTSSRAVIDWQSVELGASQTLALEQPSSAAVTLLRVTGPNPTQIAGRITANGTVVIVNPSGAAVEVGAQSRSGGLIMSAPGISNQNFMAGNLVFNQAPHPDAAVINAAGSPAAGAAGILVNSGGTVVLLAPRVANSGVIAARLGHVLMLGAYEATVDLYGDGLVSFDANSPVTQNPGGTALVAQRGEIVAAGGTTQLAGDATDGLVSNIVTDAGRLINKTIGSQTGKIVLGGQGGSVSVNGVISAAGAAAGQSGGQIQVLGQNTVLLGAKAALKATGAAGGGTVAIGTTLKRAAGGASVTGEPTSAAVKVAAGANVSANALKDGDGGRICVLSSTRTVMAGRLSVTGGVAGGNGGFVEVSGATLALTGTVDLSAPFGTPGTLLLDPRHLIFHPRHLIW